MKKLLSLLLILCLLLPAAHAATVFSPDNARDGKIQALNCLQHSSFGAEYHSTNSLLSRWNSDILIYVGGSPTTKDISVFNDFIMQLSFRCPFLPPITCVSSASQANVCIYYAPLDQLKSYIPGYVEGNWGFFNYRYNRQYEIVQGSIAIASDVTRQNQRNHLLMEELVGVLGLSKDHELYSDSIVYASWTETQELSEIDWLMLNMLYHPDLSCGMDYEEARRILLSTF